jgi:hypothetical protein
VIGSNSAALRQHAYSVFTASRREPKSYGPVPQSVQTHLAQSPLQQRPGTPGTPGRADRTAEAKPLGVERTVAATPSGLLPAVPRMNKPAPWSQAHGGLPGQGPSEPTQEDIRRRAYEIFQSRHGQPGDPVADWLRAEAELRRERGLA